MLRSRDDPDHEALWERPHQRHNPLLDEWVTVSPQRTRRPWQGAQEAPPQLAPPAYDPDCYLCPGNDRAGGRRNPLYQGTWWFDNDFPALDPAPAPAPGGEPPVSPLYRVRPATGICRVVCFSPRHDLHLAALPEAGVERVVDLWTRQYQDLISRPGIVHVQIFENRGPMMGASNPHPHCQIWADGTSPTIPAREQAAFAAWPGGGCLLCDYASGEVEDGSRVVFCEGDVICLVPFWATWPFEVMLLSPAHRADLTQLEESGRRDWARAMRRLVAAYDRLFGVPFPYSMGIHQRSREAQSFHFHAHYYPPLLRSGTVRKFMVGYEMLAQAQRDVTPEAAAERLRQVAA